jgi:hypothetical protein
MSSIRDSSHFVPIEHVPQIRDTTALPAVFHQLSERGAGGFILLQAGRPRYYVRADVLAKRVLARATEGGWGWIDRGTILDLVEDPRISLETVPVLEDGVQFDTDSGVVSRGTAAILPVMQAGQQAGWFFSQEMLVKTIGTKPPRFMCRNGHANPDPDHGTCYKCPAAITGTA